MAIEELDKVRVSVNFELGDGTQYQNIYHYIRNGSDPFSNSAITTNIAAQVEDMYDELAGFVTTDVVEKLSFVDKIEFIDGQWEVTENVGTFTISFTPTQTGDALPYTVAPFVIFKTTRPKTVGRKFLFPVDEAWQADSIAEAGLLAAMVLYGAEVLSDAPLSAGNFMACGVPRTGVNQWLTFQVAVANDVLGSQKRRRPGVGA